MVRNCLHQQSALHPFLLTRTLTQLCQYGETITLKANTQNGCFLIATGQHMDSPGYYFNYWSYNSSTWSSPWVLLRSFTLKQDVVSEGQLRLSMVSHSLALQHHQRLASTPDARTMKPIEDLSTGHQCDYLPDLLTSSAEQTINAVYK